MEHGHSADFPVHHGCGFRILQCTERPGRNDFRGISRKKRLRADFIHLRCPAIQGKEYKRQAPGPRTDTRRNGFHMARKPVTCWKMQNGLNFKRNFYGIDFKADSV